MGAHGRRGAARLMLALGALGGVGLAVAEIAPPKTFGSGILSEIRNSTFAPVVLLEHRLGDDAAYGVITHFWNTGEIINYETVVDYYVDGEDTPSISFQPSMASGQGYPREEGSLGGSGDLPPYGVFSAGEKMGKNAQVGGWYNYHKVLFMTSIRITARTLHGPQATYLAVRGHEVAKGSSAAEGLRLPSGYVVPARAKLQLVRIDNVTFQPLAFAPIFALPKGYAGLVYLITLAISTSPAGNDYIEGCWHLYREAEEPFPGLVVGTGTEDFFDSAYYFCAVGQPPCLFAHATAGLLHFSRVYSNGSAMSIPAQQASRPYGKGTRERFSAYRFFDQEVVGFADGGALQWRIGDTSGKCTDGASGATLGRPSAVSVSSYAWVYTWPLDPHGPAAPNSPPLQGGVDQAGGPGRRGEGPEPRNWPPRGSGHGAAGPPARTVALVV